MRPKFKKLSCSHLELLLLGKVYPYQIINITCQMTYLRPEARYTTRLEPHSDVGGAMVCVVTAFQ